MKTKSKPTLYKPHLYYKLYSALRNDGWEDKDMTFDQDVTYILPEGFFSFRFEHGEAVLTHLLVWPEMRGRIRNIIALYRAFQFILLSVNEVTFIATVPAKHEYFYAFLRWAECGRELKPYATDDKNSHYRVTFRR